MSYSVESAIDSLSKQSAVRLCSKICTYSLVVYSRKCLLALMIFFIITARPMNHKVLPLYHCHTYCCRVRLQVISDDFAFYFITQNSPIPTKLPEPVKASEAAAAKKSQTKPRQARPAYIVLA